MKFHLINSSRENTNGESHVREDIPGNQISNLLSDKEGSCPSIRPDKTVMKADFTVNHMVLFTHI